MMPEDAGGTSLDNQQLPNDTRNSDCGELHVASTSTHVSRESRVVSARRHAFPLTGASNSDERGTE